MSYHKKSTRSTTSQLITNSLIYLLIILFTVIVCNNDNILSVNSLKQSQRIKFDNDYLKNLYSNELIKTRELRLDGNDEASLNLKKVQLLLASENGRYAMSIELTGLEHIFSKKTFDNNLSNQTTSKRVVNLVELFFPLEEYGQRIKIEKQIENNQIDVKKFELKLLNMSGNGLTDDFLNGFIVEDNDKSLVYSTLFNLVLSEYFSHLKLLQFSFNKFRHLERKHLEIFASTLHEPSRLETILFDSNEITSIKHDTFYDFNYLKNIDLSNNKIKLIHPLTFSMPSSAHLNLLNLSNNYLKTIFETPVFENRSNESYPSLSNDQNGLPNLKYLFLDGNDEINCDCGLLWLYNMKNQIYMDDFKCVSLKNGSSTAGRIQFNEIESERVLNESCKMPNLVVDTHNFEESSQFSLFRMLSRRWFAWTVFFDHLPSTTPYPYLMTNKDQDINQQIENQQKHVFHVWRGSDAVFQCNNKDEKNNEDNSRSTIIWKTQYGYLSYLDKDLMQSLVDDSFDDSLLANSEQLKTNKISGLSNSSYSNQTFSKKDNYYSFKIFYKMNKLTKIYKNLTVSVRYSFGAHTHSKFYVNYKNQLVVTKMRQVVAGPFVCISINERGVNMYEYDMHVRTGVGEFFIYSLFVSLVSMIIPSIIGIIICCVCEYQADKNYPMTPPCYPTPQAQTPPNFDFNEWMANAASYLPNINIHDTLEQVSKKLRKGMEKASVTVKSLGLTSTAYIYSMYEQSSQRWSDIKSYVPTLNVNMPNLTLPTMKYPPVGQLANRMRMGMGNMFGKFWEIREFCGTSDLTHTASIVDIDIDTSASNAVGKTYIMDQLSMNKQSTNHQHGYYRFLHLIREESSKYNNGMGGSSSKQTLDDNTSLAQTPSSTITTISLQMNNENSNMPTTSKSASNSIPAELVAIATTNKNDGLPKINLYVKIPAQPQIPSKIEDVNENRQSDQDDDDDDDEYSEDELNNQSLKSSNKSNSTSAGFDNQDELDENGQEKTSKLKPSSDQSSSAGKKV